MPMTVATTTLMVVKHMGLLAHVVFQGHPFVPSLHRSVSIFLSCINQIFDCLAEDGFDISPDEDECRALAILDSAPKGKGKGAPFHNIHTVLTMKYLYFIGRRVPGAATTTVWNHLLYKTSLMHLFSSLILPAITLTIISLRIITGKTVPPAPQILTC
jgi:hypothetical protein